MWPAGHRYDAREIDISKAYIQLPLDKHKYFLLQKNLQQIRFKLVLAEIAHLKEIGHIKLE